MHQSQIAIIGYAITSSSQSQEKLPIQTRLPERMMTAEIQPSALSRHETDALIGLIAVLTQTEGPKCVASAA